MNVETRLRALADAAAPTVSADPDLARTILDLAGRQRRTRRLRRAAIGAGSGLLVIGTLAAATVFGRSDYFAVTEPSNAMEPTIVVGERVVVDRRLSPQRGDIVFAHVRDDGVEFEAIFRVAALPGDTIGCPADPAGRCAALVVNGQPVPEPHLAGETTDPFPTHTVPAGTVFLLGDNRDVANDSRRVGPVDVDALSGVAVRIVDGAGRSRTVPGAPAHAGPGDHDNVDPARPVPPANATPAGD
jgi:signal peptidase I